MPDFHAELWLLIFVILNSLVFGSAWFFASRRMTASRSQALLDAVLLGYAVQCGAVGIPGIFHVLAPPWIDAVALILSALLLVLGWAGKRPIRHKSSTWDERITLGAAVFAVSFTVLYAHSQASLPVISNDAMTYQFPAAIQWLQQGRISLFQSWFFNPANTYSPLAGSMFVLWMIAPFGSDVVAQFVEVPALFCVGIAMFRLCREMKVRAPVAGLVAMAGVLARPVFLPSMMGKDDLFVVFFFIASLVALSNPRSGERFGALRFGLALGLLLATKYTVLLIAPVLLLAITEPGWGVRGWLTSLGIAVLLAGPWYLRNWILTGNPIFPMFSLFTTAPSEAFATAHSAIRILIGGTYALPRVTAIVLAAGWVVSLRWIKSDPLIRACSVGAVIGFLIFFLKSPFPEVRFVLPMFVLLFGCAAVAVDRLLVKSTCAFAAGLGLVVVSLLTIFAWQFVTVVLGFALVAFFVTLFVILAVWWAKRERLRAQAVIAALAGIGFVYAYVYWQAYCRVYRLTMFDELSGYEMLYPELNEIWRFADQNIPADATLAYTNLYLIYPLQADAMQRKLVYAPTRPNVKSIADLGWLGSNLPGEKLVPAAAAATVAGADRSVWMANLRASGAKYLVVGRGGEVGVPVEVGFANAEPNRFALLFEGSGGWVYLFTDGPEDKVSRTPGRR